MGNVVAVQGDSMLKTPELHVAYEGKAAAEMMTAAAQPQQPDEARACRASSAKDGAVVTVGMRQARSQRPGRVRR